MKTDIEIAEEIAAKRKEAEEKMKSEEEAAAKSKEEEASKEDDKKDGSGLDGLELELSEETVSEVEKEVLAANNGKAKEELADEIEAAKKERLEKIKEEKADYLKKYKEIASLEENEGKTDEEIQALVDAALEDASEEEEKKGEGNKEEDPLKDFSGLKDEVKDTISDEDGKEVKLPDDVKSELEEYRSLKEDKVLSAFLEAKKAGTTKEFVDEFRNSGLHINIKEIPPKQIYQWSLQNMKAIDSTITDEEITEKVEAFEDMDKFERAQITAPLYSQMEEEQKAAREAFFGKVTETASSVKAAAQEEFKQVESELKKLEGATPFGVEITPEVTEKMLSKIRKGEGIRFTDSSGKVDVRKTIEAQLLYDNFDDVKSAIFSRGQKSAIRKETVKRGKPNLGINIKATAPSTTVTRQKKLQSAIEIAYGAN